MPKGQVVYLPGFRQVPHEEMVARMMLQDDLSLFHIEFEQAYRHLTYQEFKERKEAFHHKLRQSMTVIEKPF